MPLTNFPHVYQPLQVGNMRLKNRIQYSPIVTNHAGYRSGEVTHQLLEFVSGQAKTGVGIVTIGSTPVNFEEARDFFGCLSATKDDDVPGLTQLAEELHRYDCKLSAELIHGGQWGALTLPEGRMGWVPSVVEEYHDPKRLREITRAEMLTVIDDFVAALKRCMKSFFDMAMIHYAHGNLMSAFLSTFWNRRGDQYGGSEKNRWRFPLELLEAAYDTVKGTMPLEMRIVGNEHMGTGTPLDERIRFLKEAEKYIDMIVVSAGNLMYGEAFSYNMPGYYIPEGVNVEYAAAFKEACPNLAVSVCGGVATLEHAEYIIKTGKADIIAMAKALMADYDYVNKGARGLEKEIKPCMRCLYCLKGVNNGNHLAGCAINPPLGWEYRKLGQTPALKKKKVMVVGGGPGGMAATQYLAERGHDVVLYEKADKLGGRMFEASSLSLKDGFRRYFEYTVRKTNEVASKVVLGKEVTAEVVKAEAPDALIIAVGGNPIRPNIKGIDGPNVKDVSAVDRGDVETGSKVVVCGGGLSGTECALQLGMEGKDVTLVDLLPEDKFYDDVSFFSKPSIARMLNENNVKIMAECNVEEFTADAVIVKNAAGEMVKIPCDTAVAAFGVEPNKAMVDALCEIVPETKTIGDAVKTGMIGDAIGDAFWFTLDI
ncbi:MAG: NAD(P)/FAD-dependent oxidoreductase [Oscillospiraceae bacterium]|nr:NAD(P)/FAD-dependent oxidoreductase [Oscillospiraceae bacterium]